MEVSAAACSSTSSIGAPNGRLGICNDSSRFHEGPARAAALTLKSGKMVRVAGEGALKSLVAAGMEPCWGENERQSGDISEDAQCPQLPKHGGKREESATPGSMRENVKQKTLVTIERRRGRKKIPCVSAMDGVLLSFRFGRIARDGLTRNRVRLLHGYT